MPRPLLVLSAILCLAFGAAACGDDEDDGTVTETETVSSETSTTESTETGETTGTSGNGDAPLPPTAPASEGPAFFASPSGNIGCSVAQQGARCDIAKRDWKPTPPPEPCELDYGNGISLGANGAQFTCAGDTALGAPDVLEYEQRAQRGNFFCDSAQNGITCSDLRTGAGFFISRESFRIF
jgi:hypothetical protein